ncbi:hypothetical protein TNCV_4901351 [Trichonephila clavipes]|nr:hypothetical protein TNCV_4901351 [Trichonephila clavipes]
MQVTVRLCSVLTQFRGRKPWVWTGASHLSSSSISQTRCLVARRLFRVPPCGKGTIRLQTSMSSTEFEPRPYRIAFGLVIHQNIHQARRRFVEWAQNEIAVVPDFHKRILFSDEAHFWLNGYVNKQNCRIWSKANPQVYVKTPLHPEKLTV